MRAVELSLENYIGALSLPVVLRAFNWEHRGSALNFF